MAKRRGCTVRLSDSVCFDRRVTQMKHTKERDQKNKGRENEKESLLWELKNLERDRKGASPKVYTRKG